VEQYDPGADKWTRKADMPTSRWGLSTCAVNGKIYAIGGCSASGAGLVVVEEYDPGTDSWTRKANMSTPRGVFSTSTVNGIIYAIGGSRGQGGSAMSTVEAYDPTTNTWTQKASMPRARHFHSSSVLDGKIYVIGGCLDPYSSSPFSSVVTYDPATDRWTEAADMPTGRKFLATCAVEGKIYAMGGSAVPAFNNSISTVEVYDLTPPPPDFNGDGRVDGKDVLILAQHWGQDDPFCDIAPAPFGDGVVDVQDLTVLAGYVGKEVNDPALIADWKLDEIEGITACDSAGYNNATLCGSPLWQPDGGAVNGALALDGIDDFLGADFALDPSEGPFSIFAWIKGGAPGQVIVSQIDGTNWLGVDPVLHTLVTELRSEGRFSKSLHSEALITDDTWHRIGFSWDGLNRRLYVDDILVGEHVDTSLSGCRGGLNIGCGKDMAPGTFFTGLIDDVRIYNRALAP
jgi:N-acetylneuraminic acid mutarotase